MSVLARKKSRISGLLGTQGPLGPVRSAANKALAALETTELLAPVSSQPPTFKIEGVELEVDCELPSWKYAVIKISLPGVSKAQKSEAESLLIEALYSKLDAREATRVLVEFV